MAKRTESGRVMRGSKPNEISSDTQTRAELTSDGKHLECIDGNLTVKVYELGTRHAVAKYLVRWVDPRSPIVVMTPDGKRLAVSG